MHDRSANDQVFGKFVFQVRTEKRFALHRERALVLEFNIHVRAALEYRLVENSDRSHRIIDSVVHVLDERGATGGDSDTSTRYIHCAQTYLATVGSFVFTGEVELVFLAQLLRHYQCRVV